MNTGLNYKATFSELRSKFFLFKLTKEEKKPVSVVYCFNRGTRTMMNNSMK